jgi:hypothetical protein
MIGGLWKSTGGVALLTAAGLYLGSVGMSPAQAADLGGDCCADLEERVAEREATTARKGNRRVSLTISGQVTTAVMAWSDGSSGDLIDSTGNFVAASDSGDAYIVDNVMAGGTFFALTGSARINPALSAGFNVTMALCSGARSHHVNQTDDDASTPGGTCFNGAGDTTTVITLANWYLDHKSFGRVTVGRINTATAGLTTIDLGGAGVIANASIGYTQRGFFLVEDGDQLNSATWTQALGGNSVNGASLSRANAVSYTSPTFGGFSVAGAWGEDDIWDVALRYAGEFSGFRFAAGIGYINNSSGLNEVTKDHAVTGSEPSQVKGSASILHVASGLYLTGAYVNQDNDAAGRPDTTLWYLQGGIGQNWTGLGKTVLYAEYAQIDDPMTGLTEGIFDADNLGEGVIESSRARMWGIGVVQHLDAAAMELFLSYKRFSLDAEASAEITGMDFSDFQVVMGGARIRF